MAKGKQGFGAKCRTVNLGRFTNYPRGSRKGEFWAELKEDVLKFPGGDQQSWGIPFRMGDGTRDRVVLAAKGKPDVRIPLRGTTDFLCFLHEWAQLPEDTNHADPH